MSLTIEEDEPRDLNTAIEKATDLLTRFAIPLYREENGAPAQVGSGFFISYEGEHFLVSAAHVLENLKDVSLFYYVEPQVIRQLSGRLVLSPWAGPRDNDPVDIGVLKLAGKGQPPYPSVDKYAMDLSYLCASRGSRVGKRYAVLGFPASRSKINRVDRQVTAEPFAFLARSIPEDQYIETGHNPSIHLVMSFDRKRSFDLDGGHRVFPKPSGISGSPIFELYEDEASGAERVFTMVGMVTSHKPQQRRLIGIDSQLIRGQIQRAI